MSFAWLSGKSARMPWRLLLNSNNSYSLSPRREVVDKQCNISKIKIDWVVFFALFLALLMFVPLIIKADFHLEGSKEDREYRDINCVIAVLCSISALSPLVIDMILDLIYVPTAYATYLYLRTIGLGALLMYDVIYLVALHFKNFTLYAEVADNFEYMVTVSVALLFFRDLDTKECWTNYRIIVLLLIYFSYFVFNVIHLMFPSTFSRYSEWESIPDYLLYAGCLCIYFQWFWRFFNEFKVKNQVICMANVSFKDGYVIILMIPFSMVALFVFVNSRVNAYDTKEYRVNMTVMRTVYMIVIAYLPGRMIRQAANDILLVNETNRLDAEMIKLQSDLRMKRNFVRHVSHEIRTPLSTVFSGLELIAVKLNKLQVSHGVAEVLDDIQDVSSSCDAALLIVNDLLSYEKLDSGLMTLETLTVFAVPFIGKSIAPFRLMSESKGVHIKAYFKDNLQSDDSFLHSYQIDADTNKLVQVVRNLCSNAIKFTPKGGLVQIGLTIDHLNKQLEDGPNEGMLWLRVTFKDSGVGIAPENISKLFGEGNNTC